MSINTVFMLIDISLNFIKLGGDVDIENQHGLVLINSQTNENVMTYRDIPKKFKLNSIINDNNEYKL